MPRTAGENDFIKEYTRSLLVDWAGYCLKNPALPENADRALLKMSTVYVECALDNGWISKSTPHRVTSKGFKAAAAFLRR